MFSKFGKDNARKYAISIGVHRYLENVIHWPRFKTNTDFLFQKMKSIVLPTLSAKMNAIESFLTCCLLLQINLTFYRIFLEKKILVTNQYCGLLKYT